MTELSNHSTQRRQVAETQWRKEFGREFLAPSRPGVFALNPALRDYLLPRLLSGRVRVTGVDDRLPAAEIA